MSTLKDQIVEKLTEKSATYDELRVWTKKMPHDVRVSQLETSLQQAIYEGQVLYKADYKYHVA